MKIILPRCEAEAYLKKHFSNHGLIQIESVEILDAPVIDLANAVQTVDPYFIDYPESTLPNGRIVPAFKYAVRPCTKGADGKVEFDPSAKPWVNINYFYAKAACEASGYKLSSETQELVIRLDVARQDINWTGGKVGEGKIYQGIHKGKVSSAQAADYVSDDPEERSWHQLSTGTRIYGLAGNCAAWISDDVQGNEKGIVVGKISSDSISLTTAPYPSMKNGMGYRPNGAVDLSGVALVRGGCWSSGDDAGVFDLGNDWPDRDNIGVGFRCTK